MTSEILAKFANYCRNPYLCKNTQRMDYRTEITPLMRDVCNVLVDECVGVNSCIVQHPRNLVVEVSKSDMIEVISALKKHFPDVVDIRKAYPMIEDLHDYILVKPLISEAPVLLEDNVPVPTIEKLLVDQLADKEFQRETLSDSIRRFQHAMEQYNVNTSRLVRYATRKGKKEEINEILGQINNDRIATVRAICQVLSTAPVLRAWLFGSFARMEERPDSDIDLLVTLDKSAHMGLFAFSDLVNQLEAASGRPVDLVPEEALKQYARPSVNKDKRLVYERY